MLFLFAVLVLAGAASAHSRYDISVRQQIRLLNREMEAALNANDMQQVAAFYSDDSEIVYDNGYTVKGRTNPDRYWTNLKDRGRGWKLTVVEAGGDGELVYQLGQSDLKYLKTANKGRSPILLFCGKTGRRQL